MVRLWRTKLVTCITLIALLGILSIPAMATTYSVDTGIETSNLLRLNIEVTGFNKTHGFFKPLKTTLESYDGGSKDYWRINYELPDDGSTWEVYGNGFVSQAARQFTDNGHYITAVTAISRYSFTRTITTPGTFTGVSLDQVVTEIQNINTKINNFQTTINSNQAPQVFKVSGLNGATCTTSSTFFVVVQTAGATHFRAGTSPGTGNTTKIGNPCNVTLSPGANTIYVEVWNENNPEAIATGQMTAFRL